MFNTVVAIYLLKMLCVDSRWIWGPLPDISRVPEQVHIALGAKPSTMVVTWVTMNKTSVPTVLYGMNQLNQIGLGNTTKFVDGGLENRTIYVHRVTVHNIIAGIIYKYKCGSREGWSKILTFRALLTHPYWSPRLVIFGDMGLKNAVALKHLIKEVTETDTFDVLLHVGDFAYDMPDENGRVGDAFMRKIEGIASRVPYMTCVGNHEMLHNFSHYKNRFSMPETEDGSLYYSFNLGPAHIISISTEFYYYVMYGWIQIVNQYRWLINDLKEANKPYNRKLRPWIIVFGHRPMYCSNNDDPMHCDNVDNAVRVGFPFINQTSDLEFLFGLEKLFYDNGVDIIFGAHEHSYERFWPVFNRIVCNSSNSNPYLQPQAPVHIVTGSAGCVEGEDPFTPTGQPWSAFRSDDYGYTRMQIINSTHVHLEQISVTKTPNQREKIDEVTVIKHHHGPGTYKCHRN